VCLAEVTADPLRTLQAARLTARDDARRAEQHRVARFGPVDLDPELRAHRGAQQLLPACRPLRLAAGQRDQVSGGHVNAPRRSSTPARSRSASTEPTLWDNADADVVPAIIEQRGGEVAELVELAERARDYALSSKAANTLRAYESDLRQVAAWCEARGLGAFPGEAETVALYLTVHAGRLANDGCGRVSGARRAFR
jgi:hypothetical protein